jgi:hypothetical protein
MQVCTCCIILYTRYSVIQTNQRPGKARPVTTAAADFFFQTRAGKEGQEGQEGQGCICARKGEAVLMDNMPVVIDARADCKQLHPLSTD